MCAVRHFSQLLGRHVPETTAKRLKAEYLAAMKSRVAEGPEDESAVPLVASLPKLPAGRPLLLGKELDTSVQNYITSLRRWEEWSTLRS